MGLVAGLPSLWARDLWYGDEVRLTEGAREMLLAHAGLAPHINGEADATAPPLPYWATALLWDLGAGTASARVLSVLSVVGILLVCFAAMAPRSGPARATMAAATALTTMSLFWHVREGGPGPLWALLLTCTLLAGHQALNGRPGRRGIWWVACYVGAALAVLAVGVSAALLVALVLGVYCLVARRRPVQSVTPHLFGLATFAGVMVLGLASGHSFAPLFGDLEGFGASLREGGLPKAVLTTAAALLPWVITAPLALVAVFRERQEGRAALPLFAAICLGVLAVPAVLGGREGAPSYSIAMVPPLAMLCAGALAPGGAVRRTTRWPMRVALAVVGLPSALVLVAGVFDLAGGSYLIIGKSYVCPVTDQPYSPYALIAVLPFVGASLAAVVAAYRTPGDRPDRQAWLLVVAVFLLGIPGDLFLTPFVNAFRSTRPFAQKVVQHVRPEDAVYLYRKDYDGLYNLYTGRMHIPVLKDQAQLLECLSHPGVFVIADRDRVKKVTPPVRLSDLSVAWGRAGHGYMLLLRSEPVSGSAPPANTGRQRATDPAPHQ